MTRTLLILALCATQCFGAQYNVKLNPGDSVLVEAVTVTSPVDPPPVVAPPVVPTIPFGVNLSGGNDWDGSAFTRIPPDLMTFARQIGTNKWRVLTAGDISIRYEDPPGSGVFKWSTFGSKYPKVSSDKPYLLSYDGAYGVTASGGTVKNWVNNNGKVTAELYITSDTVNVDLQFAGPATNIVLLRPGYARGTTQAVTDEFKAWVAPFSYIRYMDVQCTNWHFPDAPSYATDAKQGVLDYFAMRNAGMTGASFVASIPYAFDPVTKQKLYVNTPLALMKWADRPSDTAQTMHRVHGVSPEWIVRVANETKTDIWYCLPPTFSDDFATGLAQLFKSKLDPGRHVYLEYGNEMPWNDIPKFGQAQVVIALAKEALKTNPNLNNDGQNEWYMGTRYVLQRTVDAAKIFKTVFGDAEFDKRIHPIFGSQHTNPGYAGNALLWGLRYSDLSLIEGAAIAPYVAGSTGTVSEMQAKYRSDFEARSNPMSWQSQWRGIVDGYGPYFKAKRGKLFGYECGYDGGQGIPNLANRIALAHDPATELLTRDYLASIYYGCGMESVAWFNGISSRGPYTPQWGLTHDPTATSEPMYKAAVAFAQQPAIVGGVKMTFFKDATFTTQIAQPTITPLVFHSYEAWKIGSVVGRTDVAGLLQTRVVDGAIRFEGRYLGTGALTVEKDKNDTANLTLKPDGTFTLDYVARFDKWAAGSNDGSGIAWVRLMANGKPVRAGMFSTN